MGSCGTLNASVELNSCGWCFAHYGVLSFSCWIFCFFKKHQTTHFRHIWWKM